jgi:hypothetical protein
MDTIALIKIAKELIDMGLENEADDILSEVPLESKEEPKSSINSDQVMNDFIGGIMLDLAQHNNIKFDNNGNLSAETLRSIINSFEENLSHPDMS